MKKEIKYENLQPSDRKIADDAISRIVDAVASKLPKMEPDLQRLEAHVQKAAKGNRFGISLRLHLPSATLVVRKEKTDLPALLAEAREDIVRQVRRYMARLRHLHTWRKNLRVDHLSRRKAIQGDKNLRERRALFFDVTEEHLDLLWNYAWRELAYLEANGDLPLGALSLQDAVDAILLAGVERFEKRAFDFDVKDWLLKLCVETLESQARQIVNALPADAEALDLSAPEPATDPTEADQEFYEFYQPDDAPTLESLIPSSEEDPSEDGVAEQETARALHRALADLPRLWRHALMLIHVEDLSEEQVVEILGISPVELTDILCEAPRFLKARLAESRETADLRNDADIHAALRSVGLTKPVVADREAILGRIKAETVPN